MAGPLRIRNICVKILAICSSLDLRLPYSCTPAWWQLLEALARAGAEVIVTPYAGHAVESPWWRAYENPCLRESAIYAHLKNAKAKLATPSSNANGKAATSLSDRATRKLAGAWVRPKWERHLRRIFETEKSIDAVLVLTVPPNQIAGLPAAMTNRFGVPFYFYDGDVPASLPRFSGFQSGFNIYPGADLSEYEAFLSNSKAGGAELLKMGARAVHTLYFGADPSLFSRVQLKQDIDIFFYGHGGEYREDWIDAMIAKPTGRLPDVRFAVRGSRFGIDLDRVEHLPYLSMSKLREYCSRSRINLLITRSTHASVYGSSTCRPFELAALGSCMISNPYEGIEEWFEPEKEVIVVASEDEAVERYQWLLSNDLARERIADAAHERLISEHTYEHRAQLLLNILKGNQSAGVRTTSDELATVEVR